VSAKRVVVVGGAGVFGSRLARGLVATTDAEVLIAGRDRARTEAAVRETGAKGAVVLNRLCASAAHIAALKADLIVDAAGPFQGADLSFARACIASCADYIDLADARDFVAAFPSLDNEAKVANVRAITGASSTPALTNAALDKLTAGWRRIDTIRAGISAGNRAPRGRSLIEAILSWTGAPVRVFEGGHWITRRGWSGLIKHAIPQIGRRRFSLAETPDLDLIPARFSPREDGVFMAGLELGVLHHSMSLISALRAARILRNPRPLAGALQHLASLFSAFGTDRGCMFVEVFGRDADGYPARAEWMLTAPPVEGPFTPTLPALALARKLLAGESIAAGARPCVGLLSLDDLAADFARHRLKTSFIAERLTGPFEMALGAEFERLPAAVQEAHRQGPVARFAGTAHVDGATGLAALPAAIFGLPHRALAAPVEVEKRTIGAGREIWKRSIGGSRFKSEICYAAPGRVTERFGPFTFDLALTANDQRHVMTITGWKFGPISLPAFLAPRSTAVEAEAPDGSCAFDVPIAAPLLGRLTRYRGRLRSVSEAKRHG
jgi:hypothetical protein